MNSNLSRTSAAAVEHHRPTVYVRTSVRFTKWGIGGLSSTSQNGAKKSGQYLKRNPFHADQRQPTPGSFLISGAIRKPIIIRRVVLKLTSTVLGDAVRANVIAQGVSPKHSPACTSDNEQMSNHTCEMEVWGKAASRTTVKTYR